LNRRQRRVFIRKRGEKEGRKVLPHMTGANNPGIEDDDDDDENDW
jgi:hypothetical protein